MAGELRRYLTALRKWSWLLLLGVMVTATGTSLLAISAPTVYAATTTIKVSLQNPNNADYVKLLGGNLVVSTYQPLVLSDAVLQAVIDQAPGTTVAQLRQATVVTVPPFAASTSAQGRVSAPTLTITVTERDPALAATLANAIATTFIQQEVGLISQNAASRAAQIQILQNQTQDQITALNGEIATAQAYGAGSAQIANLKAALLSAQASQTVLKGLLAQLNDLAQRANTDLIIIQQATPPTKPVDQQILQHASTAAAAGLLLAIGLAIVFEGLDDHARQARAVERKLAPVLGVIPPLATKRPLVKMDATSPEATAYRALRAQLGILSAQHPFRTLLVTSPTADSGSAVMVGSNLAQVLAQSGKNILLIDADMGNPSLHTLFRAQNEAGLSTALQGMRRNDGVERLGLQTMPVATNITLMAAGPTPPNPADLLDSIALQRFLEAVERSPFDLVIFVAPPTLDAVDAMIIAARVDGVLLALDAAKTRLNAVEKAKNTLERGAAYLLGAVICGADPGLPENALAPLPAPTPAAPSTPADVALQETQRQPIPALPQNNARGPRRP